MAQIDLCPESKFQFPPEGGTKKKVMSTRMPHRGKAFARLRLTGVHHQEGEEREGAGEKEQGEQRKEGEGE